MVLRRGIRPWVVPILILLAVLFSSIVLRPVWWHIYAVYISPAGPFPTVTNSFGRNKPGDQGTVRFVPAEGSTTPTANKDQEGVDPGVEVKQQTDDVRIQTADKKAEDKKPEPENLKPVEAVDSKAKHLSKDDIQAADYPLSKERMHAIAEDGYITVTWSNLHYIDFVINWVEHFQDMGITAYAVGALDHDILVELVKRDINAFSLESGLTTEDFGWGSKSFHKMGRQKVALIQAFVSMGLNVIVADVDTVWMRDPIEYFRRYPRADVLASSDHLGRETQDEGLMNWSRASSPANIGILMMRPSSIDFVNDWMKIVVEDDNVWDQNAFNDVFRDGMRYLPDDPDRLFDAYHGLLRFGLLPVSLFCSGHTFFVQRMPSTMGLKPYAVHATFQFSGTPGKKNRLREVLLWNDPPEYFEHPVGFLTFNMDIPEGLLANSTPKVPAVSMDNVYGHFNLVNHQLLQIRNALAIAQILGRVLIIPEVWCGMDRWWAPHAGKIPGADFDLPFKCPLDHILDLEHLIHGKFSKDMPENEYGPDIDVREYSFLNNKRLPASVNDSRATVHVCAPGKQCNKEVSSDFKLGIQPNMNDKQLKAALEGVASRKVITFDTMIDAFGLHSDQADRKKFMKRTREYVSLWCCVNDSPGHIWYDFWFDTVPHTDRHNRGWNKTWTPVLGP